MTTVRVQGPEGSQSLELAADATVGDLKDAIADKLGIPTAAQTLLTGFPPSTLTADDSAALAATLGAAPRVLVRRAAGSAPAAPTASSNRRKPATVQRVAPGTSARDAEPPAPAPAAAAAASSSAAAASSSAAAALKRARDGDDDDGESAIPASLRPASGAERKKQAKAKAPKAKTAEQIATAYYHAGSSGSALAARGDFLTEHGMIEHRVAALGSRKYTIDGVAAQGKGGARLDVSFKGVRNQMHESVQWLSRDEMREVLRLLASRGSSSRRTASAASHLLAPREMAARSPAMLWSLAHEFYGDITGGVDALQVELATQASQA
jgi:hypothetical protein